MQLKEYFWVPNKERKQNVSRVGLVQLALPIMLENVLRVTVGVVDIAFLSRLSDEVVSAVSISNQYITFCQMIAVAMATSATVCVNQALGMKNREKVNLFATIALSVNMLLGLFFGALFLTVPHVFLKIMSLKESALSAAVLYMRIAGGMMVIQCVEIVLEGLCRSLGRIRAPMVISLFSNIVNVIGNYLAVFHSDWFWNVDPVAGVAIATVISRVVALLIALFIARRSGLRVSPKYLRPFPKASFRLVLSIAIPGGVNMVSYSLGQIVTTAIVSFMSKDVSFMDVDIIAAKVYVTNIVQYVAIIGQSFSTASSVMVGYRLGAAEYDEAKKVCKIVMWIALLSNGIISLSLITVRYPLIRFFTKDEAIIALAAAIFFLDFPVEIGRALNHSIGGALQAAGDMVFQLFVNQGSAWIIAVGGSYLFGIVCHLGLYGVWMAFACDELFRGITMLLRWKSERWLRGAQKKKSVIADKNL